MKTQLENLWIWICGEYPNLTETECLQKIESLVKHDTIGKLECPAEEKPDPIGFSTSEFTFGDAPKSLTLTINGTSYKYMRAVKSIKISETPHRRRINKAI